MVNIILYTYLAIQFLYWITYYNVKIVWNVGEDDEQAAYSRGAVPGDLYSKVGQVPVGWYSIQDHIRKYLILVSNTFHLLYLLLFKSNIICFISFNCSMSSPSGLLRLDHSSPNGTMGALMIAHVSVMMRYGPKRLAVATKGGLIVWGPPIIGHILQFLCLKLGLLGLMMWRISGIGCMH